MFFGGASGCLTVHDPEGEKQTTPGAALAAKFGEFLVSKQGQEIIRSYGKGEYGQSLYDEAAYARQYE